MKRGELEERIKTKKKRVVVRNYLHWYDTHLGGDMAKKIQGGMGE